MSSQSQETAQPQQGQVTPFDDVFTKENQSSPGALKRAELEKLSDSELEERFVSTFATKGQEMEKKDIVNAIVSNTPNPPAPVLPPHDEETEKFTSKQTGKEFKVPKGVKADKVIRQVHVQMLGNGMVETPGTETLGYYTNEVWKELQRTRFFEESNIRAEELK